MLRRNFVVLFLVLFGVLLAGSYVLAKPQRVELMANGIKLVGTYYPVKSAASPAVILIHRLGRNRGDWNELARYIQKEGIAVLSIDLRGHGESTNLKTIYWKLLDQDQYPQMLEDIGLARTYLIKTKGHNHKKIGLLGAYLGANLAAKYAEEKDGVASLVLWSPGVDYKGIKFVVFNNFTAPAYLICSDSDQDAQALVAKMKQRTYKSKIDVYNYEPKELYSLNNKLLLFKNVVSWFKDTLLK